MFPVYTGINRSRGVGNFRNMCVPCIHRDKPDKKYAKKYRIEVFPVYTGINRSIIIGRVDYPSVPCIHRDKPEYGGKLAIWTQCSLYTQG